ncbi:hypothetical protein V1264_001495 [Littorina saxatilis]|uniref:Ig-like domain-containing protein n=1 Tax=Littorina saxatilis TaxID=31220 RepID=A0AAN9GPT0_9CAEN
MSFLFSAEDFDPDEQKPEFLNTPTHVTVKEGALAILPCWVRHLGDREVAWRSIQDDSFLTIGKVTWVQDSNLVLEHLRKGDGVTSWDLIFRRVRLDQAGDYECQVTSQEQHVRMVTLTVIDEPTYNSQLIVPTGQMIHLVCNVSAENTTDFDLAWHKNGHMVDSHTFPYIVITRYQIQSSRTFVTDLIIDNASLDDSGIYTCRTSSRHVLETSKVTVVRSDPSSNKREEARGDTNPDMPDDKLEEHNMLDDRNSYFSIDQLRTNNEGGNGGGSSLHKSGRWLTVTVSLLLWGLLLRHHIPANVIQLPAS